VGRQEGAAQPVGSPEALRHELQRAPGHGHARIVHQRNALRRRVSIGICRAARVGRAEDPRRPLLMSACTQGFRRALEGETAWGCSCLYTMVEHILRSSGKQVTCPALRGLAEGYGHLLLTGLLISTNLV
jgi:hypothetical protein